MKGGVYSKGLEYGLWAPTRMLCEWNFSRAQDSLCAEGISKRQGIPMKSGRKCLGLLYLLDDLVDGLEGVVKLGYVRPAGLSHV